jgi:hypothetical protein
MTLGHQPHSLLRIMHALSGACGAINDCKTRRHASARALTVGVELRQLLGRPGQRPVDAHDLGQAIAVND